MIQIKNCPVCGGLSFFRQKVLWQELISDWQLSPVEVEYIDRQQGYACKSCGNNLRSMALAGAILSAYKFSGTLSEFVHSDLARELSVLEINDAGGLSAILNELPNHRLVRYPEYDMTNLAFASDSFDLVIHSDTLEHVPQPIAGMSECKRVLKTEGRCIFTAPIVVGRLSRTRAGLKESYHGTSGQENADYVVHTEFGADIWRYVLEAGFGAVKLHCLDYPAGVAIEATLK
jgi:SAM-dependent methyltransferase